MSGSGPSSIIVSRNNLNFVTRGLDDTIKLWSLESPKSPIKSLSSIENYFEQTNIVYSPNEKVIVTGMSVKRNDQAYGKLLFLDASNLEIIKEIPIKPSTSVIRTLWHPKINQILVGLADGSCHVFYDPLISIRGAKLCAYKNIKEKQAYDIDFTEGVILHPHALPLYKDDDELLGRKKQDFTRAERNLRKPELPLIMRGKRGGVDTRALEKDKARTFDPTRYDDPRDAILKYAEGAEKDPYWIAPAYKKNQPENILAKRVYENEEEERQAALKRRRQ